MIEDLPADPGLLLWGGQRMTMQLTCDCAFCPRLLTNCKGTLDSTSCQHQVFSCSDRAKHVLRFWLLLCLGHLGANCMAIEDSTLRVNCLCSFLMMLLLLLQ